MNIFALLSAIALISGVSALSATTLYTQSSYNMSFIESSMIEDIKKNEMVMAELLLDGSINVVNHGQRNSTIVKLEIFDGTTSVYSTIFGSDIPEWQGITITEKDTNILPLGNMTILDTGIIDATSYLTGYITTSYGNNIQITNNIALGEIFALVNNNGTGTGNGTSILDGLGVYMNIQNIGNNGMVYFGEGDNPGKQTDIRAYVGVDSDDDWGVVITDDDYTEILYVPEFGVAYTYVSGVVPSLVNVTNTEPNILGYSEERTLSGDITISTNDDGIFFSGDGEVILKLHDYSNQSILLRGDGSSDNVIKIITSDFDLINDVYYSDGYLTYSGAIDPGENSFEVTAGIDSTHTGVLSYTGHADGDCGGWAEEYSGFTGPFTFTYITDRICHHTGENLITTTLVKTNNLYYYTITGDSTTPPLLYLGNYYWGDPVGYDEYNDNYTFEIYDTLPSVQLAGFSEEIESVLEFPAQQVYIYVKLDGGNSNIKGESFDVNEDVFFYVDGLPFNIAYDVTKSGILGAVGKTSSDGEISLLYGDVDFGIVESPGGILTIYPDSTSYIGEFGVVMADVLHDGIVELPIGDDLLYIPQNYIYWVFPISVEISNVSVDEISLPYLNGNYTSNEALYIPVIPSASIIYITINGEDVEVLMRDVSTGTQTKQVPILSSVSSDYMMDGTASTSSNISTGTFLTATHTGMMNIHFDFKVGGSVDFSMDSTYTGEFTTSQSCRWHGASSPSRSFSCNQYSTPNNPDSITNMITLSEEHQTQLITALNNNQVSNLTVEVDIIRNMGENDDNDTILIYTSNSAEAFITSAMNEARYGANNQVSLVYPQDDVNYNHSIPVVLGDMVEFVIRVNLEVAGSPTPVSESVEYSSYVIATTELGGGIISVGMS